jgi:glycosyltransferase involved in cell wall biosynthesis
VSSASLLMSVYSKVSPDALKACLFSLADQTLLPEQFVIVKDGPLTTELDILIDQFTAKFSNLTLIVNIEINQGLINALNTGLHHCTQKWIVRMDSDDVAMPDRIERQINFLKNNTDVDVLGSAMLEFDSSPKNPQRRKPVKSSHENIVKQLPIRNPINHPSVCIRKSTLLDIGGYPSLYLLEDYFLWAKLIKANARFHNLEDALILYRFDDSTLQRRRGRKNFVNECKLRWWIYQHQLSRPWDLVIGISLQCLIRFSPLFLQRYLWHASRQQLPAQDA